MSDLTSKKVFFLEGGEDLDPEEEYRKLAEEASIEECSIQLPNGHLSVTQIEMYRRCPLQYYFRYVKGLIRPPSVALVEGKVLHQSLSYAHTETARHATPPPLDTLLDVYNDSWKREAADIDWTAEENEDEDKEDVIFQRARTFLTQYTKEFLPNFRERVENGIPFVERRFWAVVGKYRVPLLGFIDLVAKNEAENKEEVIDHKVVGRAKTEDDIANDLQLTIYAGVSNINNVRFNSFVKNKNPVVKSVGGTRTVRDWDWAVFVIDAVASSISKGAFPPGQAGWWCSKKFCGYYHLCRGGKTFSIGGSP